MTLRSPLYTSAVLSLIAFSAGCAGSAPAGATFPGTESPRPVRSGETLAGTLTDADPQLEDGSRFDLYTFEGREGEEVEITLRADSFDAYVSLGRHIGGELRIVQSDDDGGNGTDARLSTVLPGTGQYLIRANSFDEDGRGDYRVSFETHGVLPEPSRSLIRVGESASASLSQGDAWMPRGSYFDLWEVEGTPGEVVRVDLQSEDFDSFLSHVEEAGDELREVRNDDDGGEGLDARLYVTVPPSGRYLIRARSLGERRSGDYLISAVSEGVRPEPEAVAVSMGDELEGSLDPLDAVLDNGTYYDEYTFHGEAGETVEVEMTSDDFDSYLLLGTGNGDEFAQLALDDDGGSGRNARIRQRLSRSGEYVIRARSFGANDTGDYTLTLGRPAPQQPPSRHSIVPGSRVYAALEPTDATVDGDRHHDLWVYEGEAGSTIQIEMTSEDFDAYLTIGTEIDGVFQALESNDDGAAGTDSRIVLRLPRTDSYVIRATSFSEGETGDYVLHVIEAEGGVEFNDDMTIEEVTMPDCPPEGCGE